MFFFLFCCKRLHNPCVIDYSYRFGISTAEETPLDCVGMPLKSPIATKLDEEEEEEEEQQRKQVPNKFAQCGGCPDQKGNVL